MEKDFPPLWTKQQMQELHGGRAACGGGIFERQRFVDFYALGGKRAENAA